MIGKRRKKQNTDPGTEEEANKSTLLGFRRVYVWSETQTEGAPLPSIGEVTGDATVYLDRLRHRCHPSARSPETPLCISTACGSSFTRKVSPSNLPATSPRPWARHSARPLPTALRAVDEMLSLHRNTGKKVSVLFHGGEPLLNFDVIQAVVEHAYADGNITFELQTNAALLNAERIKFLKDHGVGIGVSIDGPEAVHDAIRISRDGSGSYNAVLRGVELLRAADLSVGVLVVLTRANGQHVASTFDMLLRLGIRSFSFNPLFMAGRGGKNKELALSGYELFLAYRVLASKIIEHNRQCEVEEKRVEERTLKYMMQNIVRRDAAFMCMRTPCGAGTETLSFDTNGDVYVCDDFLHQPDFVLGNIHDGSLAQMLYHSPQVKQFSERTIAADPKCADCDWRMLCGGICPAHSYYEDQTATGERPECQFRQKMILHLFQLLAKGHASPDLFDRRPQETGGREFYFNINYTCNNRCVFCASDLTSPRTDHPELDVATFKALLTLNQVRKGDSVIVNGGEPTMTKHLPELLCSVAGTGAHSHLFTNGRRLSQRDYCQRILSTGVKKISIPIYGCEPEAHDRLTGIHGSFAQTVAGIAAVCECRARLALSLTLELKLLFFKPTLKLNASILSWIAREFPAVDCVSLNGLIVSKVVFGHWDELVATAAELRQSLNATLDAARSGRFESLTRSTTSRTV